MLEVQNTTEHLREDAAEREMFDRECRMLDCHPVQRVAIALATMAKMAPAHGSYGKVLAIYANECAKAAQELADAR